MTHSQKWSNLAKMKKFRGWLEIKVEKNGLCFQHGGWHLERNGGLQGRPNLLQYTQMNKAFLYRHQMPTNQNSTI